MMSWVFGVSPLPLTTPPFSVSEFSLLSPLWSLCKSATLSATFTPLALYHGPLPIRSRALTPGFPSFGEVLRYACHSTFLVPAASASAAQWRPAPSSPPRSAPFPEPTLVIKNVIGGFCCCGDEKPQTTAAANRTIERFIGISRGEGRGGKIATGLPWGSSSNQRRYPTPDSSPFPALPRSMVCA